MHGLLERRIPGSELKRRSVIEANIRYEPTELRLLFEVLQAFEMAESTPDAPDLPGRLQAVLELMSRYTGMMRGMLALIDLAGETDIAIRASFGLSEAEKEKAHYRLGEGVIGRAMASGQAVLVPRVSKEPLFLNRTGSRDLRKEEISFICVPIMVGGRALGALCADRLFADSIALEEDMRLLRVLASIIARSIQVRLDFNAMHNAVLEENRRLQHLLHGKLKLDQMVGTSKAMRPVFEELAQVADSDATVLIRGESGTGKELVARLIHTNSSRAEKPFIAVNCAALPEGLVESELFGSERGAFTGAVAMRKGRFELAQGGTLFLDEVGDMTPATQAKLLRAVQQKEFERVGGSQTLRVDVRLLAATNRDLEAMVARGEFRRDLYYRLSVFPVSLPPLRKRKDDIMPLVTHFVEKLGERGGRKISRITPAAVSLLMAYDWPGNIRELENVVERAGILSGAAGIIDSRHLPPWLQRGGQEEDGAPHHLQAASLPGELAVRKGRTLDETLGQVEKRLIEESLRESGGNMARSALALGISERIMGLRMKKYGLDYRKFRKN